MAELYKNAKDVRKTILDLMLNEGVCPSTQDLMKAHELAPEELKQVLRDLEAGIVIAVQCKSHAGITHFQEEELETAAPEIGEIFYARPFATFKNTFRVSVEGQQKWFGECAVECCGGVSLMFPGKEVVVETVCRQTKKPITLIQKDGDLLDYEPKTLRVHLGYPVRTIADRILSWCDYNSFFSSEEAVNEWRKNNPSVHGVTRDPVTISHLAKLITGGRLNYDYQVKIPILPMLMNIKKIGFTKPLPLIGLHVPDPFFMLTPGLFRRWSKNGLGPYVKFALR
jgi:hypothetical protein